MQNDGIFPNSNLYYREQMIPEVSDSEDRDLLK